MGWSLIKRKNVINMLSNDLPSSFISGNFLINSSKRSEIVEVSSDVLRAFNTIKKKGIQPLFLGMPVCDTIDREKARISLPFASKISKDVKPKVFINRKAEQLFLYSRDVWSSSILKTEGEVKKRNLVFVFNEDGIFLGMAFALSDNLLDKGKKVVLKNVIDIGYYLRCERR